MTDEELNTTIHEIMGLCQHVQEIGGRPLFCSKCHRFIIRYNFISDWRAFGLMWEFMQKHDRWEEFLFENGYADYQGTTRENEWIRCLPISFISPRPFAEAMAEFFKEDKP